MNWSALRFSLQAMLVGIVAFLLFGRISDFLDRPDREPPLALTAEQGDTIIAELRAIREALGDARPAPSAAAPDESALLEVSFEGRPSLGSRDAPVVLVEFTDFQCPFCKRFHTETFAPLKKAFIDKGLLRYVVMDMPLDFHEFAPKAAQAAHCAREQGQYWQMYHALFENTPRLEPKHIATLASNAGLDMQRFQACVASGRYLEEIQQSAGYAGTLNIGGTPAFIVGKMNGNDTVMGKKIEGAYPYAVFEGAIKALLADSK